MGASQSIPSDRRKRSERDDRQSERQGLVAAGSAGSVLRNDRADLGHSSYDECPPSHSPRAVDDFELVPPSESDSALHTDMSAIHVSLPTTPTTDEENPLQPPFHVLLLMSDTGGGHRASAQALEAAFDALYPSRVRVTIVDFWASIAGWPFNNFPAQYTFLAKRPVLWKLIYWWGAFWPTRALTELAFTVFAHARVRRYFQSSTPDLILSVHPLVNRLSLSVLSYMRTRYSNSTPPFVTVVTDLGDAHPTWFDPQADMVYVPSEPLRQMALDEGVRSDRIRLLGLPIRPAFWHAPPERQLLRAKLGMAQHIPAVLLVGGGDGVGGLSAIADAIAVKIANGAGTPAGQLVVVCGKNKSLLARMRARSWPVPVILKGFVNNMSDWMSACDILCSKAGPGTIAEAWIRGLPIILTGFLPGQEEGNVTLVTESGSGEFHTSPDAIATCAARWVLDGEERAAVAAKARALGRPSSTREIVVDIWQLGQQRLPERLAFQRRIQSSPATSQIPNGYIAMMKYYVSSATRLVSRGLTSLFGRSDYQLERPQ